MQHLGLSHKEFAAYVRQLRTGYLAAYRTTLRTLDMKVVGSVKPQVISGQVLGDRHGFGQPHGPQRRLTLSLFDPNNALGIDTDSPDDGALYYDRLVQVVHGTLVDQPELHAWVWCPLFTGRPSRLQRTDDVVDIEADDPSVLGMGNAWKPYTIPKGTLKTEAIRRILTQRVGVHRFDLPTGKARLHKPVSLHRMTHPWAVAERIAHSMDMQLLYTGAGHVRLRRLPRAPLYTFNTGPGGEITQPVATSQSMEGFANVIEVLGRNPKGPKKRIRAVVTAPPHHPLSPQRLAQNGVPYRVVKRVENDHIRSHKEAHRRGTRELEDALRQKVDISLSVLPMPFFDPGDLVRSVTTDGHPVEHRLDTFTFPIGVDGNPDMAVGWFDKPPVRARRIRR